MGMFKDMKKMSKQGKEMQKAQGKRTGMIGQLRDMPGNISDASAAVDDAMEMQQRAALLQGGGVPGTAVVKTLEPTETFVNMQPVTKLGLEVTLSTGVGPYAVDTEEMINPAVAPQVQPGAEIAVMVDPEDNARLAIDWTNTLPSA